MEPNLTLILVAGVLIGCGVYLLLERSLTRILVGFLLASNGINLLFPVMAGEAKLPAFIGDVPKGQETDPLPQAMVLTAIVITLATTAFLLTMAYRAFQVNGHDEVQDDVEDAQIRRLAQIDAASASYDDAAHSGDPGEEEGADTPQEPDADPSGTDEFPTDGSEAGPDQGDEPADGAGEDSTTTGGSPGASGEDGGAADGPRGHDGGQAPPRARGERLRDPAKEVHDRDVAVAMSTEREEGTR